MLLIVDDCCLLTSLQKFMQSCSNPLNSNISKPAMSKTPMKTAFFMVSSTSVVLHFSTMKLNTRPYRLRAMPATDW